MDTSSNGSGGTFSRKDAKGTSKSAEVGHKAEGRRKGYKKRRPAGKRVSKKEAPSRTDNSDDVEKLLSKAKAHSKAIQAVKKTVLDIQLFLLNGVERMAQLQSSGPLLTQSEYADVVTERSIARQCGYPLCKQELIPENEKKGRYRIALREHKVYDTRETGRFCSSKCLVASKTFQSTLHIHREGIFSIERLLAVKRGVYDSPPSGTHATEQDEGQSTDSPLILGIHEREHSNLLNLGDGDSPDVIEGYVPDISIGRRCSAETSEECGLASSENKFEDAADVSVPAGGDEVDPKTCPRPSPASVDRGKSLPILDDSNVETVPMTYLKSALKKSNSEKTLGRNVSWGDQRKRDEDAEKKDRGSSLRQKDAGRVRTETIRQTAACPRGADSPDSQEAPTPIHFVLESSSIGAADAAEGPDKIQEFSGDTVAEKPKRLLAAEAVASALMDAAEAAAGGQVGSAEAVVGAGLSIVSVTEMVNDFTPFDAPKDDIQKDSDEMLDSSAPPVPEKDRRWPQLGAPKLEEDADDSCFESERGGWFDAPPRNFKVEVSAFGTIWMAMEEWISAKTLAYIYGKLPEQEDEFVIANGKEYQRLSLVEGSASAQISRTFATCVSQTFPDVVRALRLAVPVSVIELHIGRLVETMTFANPLPPFDSKQWSMILALLIECLSVHRLPSIGVHLTNNMALLRKFLDSTGTSEADYDVFRGLLLPLGRLPTFSTMSGG